MASGPDHWPWPPGSPNMMYEGGLSLEFSDRTTEKIIRTFYTITMKLDEMALQL